MSVSEKAISLNEMAVRAAAFADRWKDFTSEESGDQLFWQDFLNVYGIDVKSVGFFQQKAIRGSTGGLGKIDLFWPGVLIAEQKSAGKSLEDAEIQALDYLDQINQRQMPGVVVTSDFARIRVLHLDQPGSSAIEFPTANFPKEFERFAYLVGYRKIIFEVEVEANVKASELMGKLYDAASSAGYGTHEATILLTRLLFLMFGDDTGLWFRGQFWNFVTNRTQKDATDLGAQLIALFQALDTPEDKRSANLDETIARFPYVNGGLFSERLGVASFSPQMREVLLECMRFDWGAISPAVFGSLFQAVKDKEARRSLGEHYTSEEAIFRVIGPLFLDEFKMRFDAARGSAIKLRNLRKDLGKLNFLDPACGCGNFLIVAYRELRRLETSILVELKELKEDMQLSLDATLGLEVRMENFAGIEIEEWPAKVAETAMFLVDHQCNVEMRNKLGMIPDRLPIKSGLTVRVGNALRVDWREVCPIGDDTVILGNPPFLGRAYLSPEQIDDKEFVWAGTKGAGQLDYVTCWYKRAIEYCGGTQARVALVSTNSISQGEQPSVLWPAIFNAGFEIDFAYRTFAWSSDAPGKAAVHCVIVGFSRRPKPAKRMLFEYPDIKGQPVLTLVPRINGYLADGPNILVSNRRSPLWPEAPLMDYGSMPGDGGFLSKISPIEAEKIRTSDPIAANFLRRIIGAQEYLYNEQRYCLWLDEMTPQDLRGSKVLQERVGANRDERAKSKRAETRLMAESPHLFLFSKQPTVPYIAVPQTTSENRKYIPLSLMGPETVITNAMRSIPGASLYHLGVLQSRVFQVWNATVSGRLKSDTQISAEITYNNFPWPDRSTAIDGAVSTAAKGVLTARAAHPGATLADLYDPLAMPPDLTVAHKALDAAVLAAYGLKTSATDGEVLALMLSRYEQYAAPLAAGMLKKGKRRT
jgi:hypothetical protein